MHLTHVRKSDLNLLPALAVLLEERSISRAAARHHLSQPAMSRVLQRLRETFGDELLVRTANGYELTTRARRLQHDLQSLLPGSRPHAAWRALQSTDGGGHLPCLRARLGLHTDRFAVARSSQNDGAGYTVELVAWHDKAFEDVTHGRVDLLLWADQSPLAPSLARARRGRHFCVLCERHPFGNRPLTKQAYLRYPHVLLTLFSPWGSIVDRVLAKNNQQRRIGLRVPYFGAAVLAVPGTDLIATLPRRSAEIYAGAAGVRITPFPFKIAQLRYLIAWHPSTNEEPALVWFREQLVQIFTKLR